MVFTKKRTSPGVLPKLSLFIDGQPISETNKSKFLGVIIDNKLSWKDHITYLAGKIARGIGVIIKARQYLDKNALISLYYSFVYPYYTYCNHIWGNTRASNLNRLFILQKKIIRIISHVSNKTHTAPLFQELRMLTLWDINKYLIGCFMYRVFHKKVPDLFQTFFVTNMDIHQYNTRQESLLHIPYVKTDLGKTGIRYSGAIIWNSILKSVMQTNVSECSFKNALKNTIRAAVI